MPSYVLFDLKGWEFGLGDFVISSFTQTPLRWLSLIFTVHKKNYLGNRFYSYCYLTGQDEASVH